ncbi:MAG: (Fe-S)-binding protein [Proteobacteria bacterium]|nr:(Fe-S)-binding protein [Pseudomonadota bacterium]
MLNLDAYRDLITKCSQCQLCQTTCPVFLEDMLETHLARARIGLIQAAMLEGKMPVTRRLREIVDRCLLCTNCTQTCPSWVPVDEIIAAARFELHKGKRRGRIERYLMHQAMKQRGPKGLMEKAAPLAKKLGWSPEELPAPAERDFDHRFQGVIPAEGARRARVAYYVGCATNAFYPETGEAVVRVLARNGVEVVVPEGLSCCGLPALVDGDLGTLQEMVRLNVGVLAALDVDAVVTDCTSCGLLFKAKAAKVLPEDDPVMARAEALAGKVWEATDYLNHLGLVSEPGPLGERYTYHVPCHRGWSPTLADAPRQLLDRVSGAERVEMEHPEACCGAGGAFFMEYKALSQGIRSRKTEDIDRTGSETVVTQCPACRTYLAAGLPGRRVLHPMALLARAYGF